MDFPIYQNSISVLKNWRTDTNQANYQFPDSRNPDFQKYLLAGKVTAQVFEQAIVALCCWREDREDLYPGMIAVGQVINNRAKAGWFHGNAYQNVVAENQFSSMTVPTDPQLNDYPLNSETEFLKLLANMDNLFENELIDKTDGALYYADLSAVSSGWFRNEILNNPGEHPRLAIIGRTTFFA